MRFESEPVTRDYLPRENGAQRVGGRFALSKGKKGGVCGDSKVSLSTRPTRSFGVVFIFHPPDFD
jgi:hypothetical protein